MSQRANTVYLDVDYGIGTHHKLDNMSEIDRCRYIAIWSLATKLGREMLPDAYSFDVTTELKRAIHAHSPRNPITKTLLMLQERRLIARCNDRIVVVGLTVRSKLRVVTPHHCIDCIGSVRFGLDRIGSERTTSSSQINSRFSETYKILMSIDALNYRNLTPSGLFESILIRESRRLGNDDVIAQHAERFAVWLEGALSTGKEKREKSHRPEKRFADWLKREEVDTSGESTADRASALLKRREMEVDQR